MTDQLVKSSLAALIGSTRGKIIATLAIIALVLGIIAEGFSVMSNYYGMITNREAAIKAEIENQVYGNTPEARDALRKANERRQAEGLKRSLEPADGNCKLHDIFGNCTEK